LWDRIEYRIADTAPVTDFWSHMTSPAIPESGTGPVERRVLRDRVYDLILEMLMRGDVQPGSRLGIDVLSRELDVSPTPVREALVQLERTGLVSREARRGYRVAAPLTVDQALEIFDARLVIETGAAALAAPHAAEFIDELAAAEARHHATADAVLAAPDDSPEMRDRLIEYFEADWAFHIVILKHSGNRHLLEMAESLGTHMHRRRQTIATQNNDVRLAVTEHDAILGALRQGTPDSVVEAMRTHLSNVRERAVTAATEASIPRP
jgi:DNA-binding GntR family transcriptional regulator